MSKYTPSIRHKKVKGFGGQGQYIKGTLKSENLKYYVDINTITKSQLLYLDFTTRNIYRCDNKNVSFYATFNTAQVTEIHL